jgi:hypothetical protein
VVGHRPGGAEPEPLRGERTEERELVLPLVRRTLHLLGGQPGLHVIAHRDQRAVEGRGLGLAAQHRRSQDREQTAAVAVARGGQRLGQRGPGPAVGQTGHDRVHGGAGRDVEAAVTGDRGPAQVAEQFQERALRVGTQLTAALDTVGDERVPRGLAALRDSFECQLRVGGRVGHPVEDSPPHPIGEPIGEHAHHA